MYTRRFARRALEIVEQSPHAPVDAVELRSPSSEEARRLFQSEQYDTLADDALMLPFVIYLRGCKGLRIPAEWRCLMPERL